MVEDWTGKHIDEGRDSLRTLVLTQDSEVLVQTMTPDHSIFRYIQEHSFDGIYREELGLRVPEDVSVIGQDQEKHRVGAGIGLLETLKL